MKNLSHNLSRQKGITILELMVVVVIVGILGMVAVTRYLVAQDRAHVTAAAANADHFRKALAVYSVDYGTFPTEACASPIELSVDLIDPQGNLYMVLPNDETFRSFRYSPVDEGKSYQIEIVANDNGGTTIMATPDGTRVVS
jgi:prepilin-type N-terminal cleavage/methylation domain-containing protein